MPSPKAVRFSPRAGLFGKDGCALNIIIVGDGKVGFTLAEQLSQENHDITIIDTDERALAHASESLDVMCIQGNGAAITPLKEAGVEHADMVIAATSEDETNMVCCLTAKRLGAGYAIARVRNMEYTTDLETLKKELGIDMVINPELATALEISRLLRFPNAANIDTFYRGRVELMGFLLQEGDFLCHRPLSEQSAKLKNLPVLFCAAERDGEVHIPNGSFVPLPGDKLYIIGEPVGLSQFFRLLGRYIPKIKSVFLIGGGRITYYLTTLLTKMNLPVKIVEQKMERCRQLSELFPHATIIHGDGTDQDLLEVENLASSDAFIAITDRDEDNLITALYAKHLGVPKVIPKANRQNYTGIAQSVGLDCVVSPKYITAERILQVVRWMENSKGSIMKALYRIASNQAETMEFTVNETTQNLGIPLKNLSLKDGILVAVIIHQNRIIIPEGSSVIQKGDTVIIVSHNHTILDINDIFKNSVLDLDRRMP